VRYIIILTCISSSQCHGSQFAFHHARAFEPYK
jgi:hypothetical protein